jgi:transcriptional regulator with XRE-family HTH domain
MANEISNNQIFNMQNIGRKIASLRKNANLTQMELADKLNISFQAVSNWERGNTMPDISKLPELADIFNVQIDELLGNSKSAKIVSDIICESETHGNLTADEFIEVAPLLKPNQVDDLFMKVNNGFSGAQAEKALPLLNFGGEFDCSNEELAEKFYKNNQISFFSVVLHTLSDAKISELANLAYDENNIAFFSVVKNRLPQDVINYYKGKACDDNKIAFFAVLMH